MIKIVFSINILYLGETIDVLKFLTAFKIKGGSS
jgi:hypothetical protein